MNLSWMSQHVPYPVASCSHAIIRAGIVKRVLAASVGLVAFIANQENPPSETVPSRAASELSAFKGVRNTG